MTLTTREVIEALGDCGPGCSCRGIEPAGDTPEREAANLPVRAGGGATPPASYPECDPED